MKGISIRLEDDTHRRLKCVLLLCEASLQDFVTDLLKREIERLENDLTRNDTIGTAAKLFQHIGTHTNL